MCQTILRPIKHQDAAIRINCLMFIEFIFIVCRGHIENILKHIETNVQTTCFYSYKAFLKTKRGLELI